MNNTTPGGSNNWYNLNHYFSQNSHNLCYIGNHSNPAIQPRILQQNYFNYPTMPTSQYVPYYNHNSENMFHTIQPTFITPNNDETEKRHKKNRRERTTYTKFQIQILENYFKTNAYPDNAVREAIRLKIQTSEQNIQVWFKNRRAKEKRLSKKTENCKSSPKNEDSILNSSEISYQNHSNSDRETLNSSGNMLETVPELNVKREYKANNELYYMNNNNDESMLPNANFLPNVHFQPSQLFYPNYINYPPQPYGATQELN